MKFYDYNKIISYNCPVNVLIGERGVGKSYGAKKYVIDKFLKKKEKFLYIRRYDNELKALFSKDYFLDIRDKYPDHKLVSAKRKFLIDGEVARVRKKTYRGTRFKISLV